MRFVQRFGGFDVHFCNFWSLSSDVSYCRVCKLWTATAGTTEKLKTAAKLKQNWKSCKSWAATQMAQKARVRSTTLPNFKIHGVKSTMGGGPSLNCGREAAAHTIVLLIWQRGRAYAGFLCHLRGCPRLTTVQLLHTSQATHKKTENSARLSFSPRKVSIRESRPKKTQSEKTRDPRI